MDYFSLFLDGLCLSGQSVMHIVFAYRLTGKTAKAWYFVLYLLLLSILELLSRQFGISEILPISAELLLLYSVSRFAMGNRTAVSWTAAILAVYIPQLSFGLINSIETVVFPHAMGKRLLYLLVLLATLAAFAICGGCYAAVLKCLSLTEDRQAPYVGVLLLPVLFFFAAELYILQTSYSSLQVPLPPGERGKHGALLLLQALGLGALLCTLYAYQRLRRSLRAQAAAESLSQMAQAQKTYIAEAQMRYEQTKAFRHDINNHLSILNGLLSSGKLEESRAYLQKLETASGALSFPCQTGHPVVDILLGEKLRAAKAGGIPAEVSLLLPRPCGVDEFDLCVIFANALDNALAACREAEGGKSIRVRGERQGDFYMLAFENTCPEGPLPPEGTGLSNIRAAAEKYHGTVLAEKTGSVFRLHVLLNISGQSNGISDQTS